MSRFFTLIAAAILVSCSAFAQQPSGTSASPAPGTHMDQSTVQTVGTTPSGSGATVTNPRPSPDAGTALPTLNSSNALVSNPPQPVTKTLSGGGLADPNDVADLLSPKPLQPSKLSLIGGTVKSIDQIRDHMTVRVYGTGNMNVKFDQRTHFFRDGKETTQLAVKKGDRVYLDTQLFEGKVFAKNVHVETGITPADASGQIVSYNAGSGDMVVHDELAGTNVKFRVSPQTVIKNGTYTGNASALQPGALIAVKFSPRSRTTGTADEVSIIAEPGTSFTYFGRVTHLDLRSGLLAIENQADGKTYEVHLDRSVRVPDNLIVGSQVTVVARFEGRNYTVQSIEVNGGPDQAKAGNEDTDLSSPGDQNQSSDHEKSKKKEKNKNDDQ
jgi:hypothetical protein